MKDWIWYACMAACTYVRAYHGDEALPLGAHAERVAVALDVPDRTLQRRAPDTQTTDQTIGQSSDAQKGEKDSVSLVLYCETSYVFVWPEYSILSD